MKSTGLKLMIHRLADCGEGAKGPPPLPFSSHRCSSTKKEGGYSSGFSKSGRFTTPRGLWRELATRRRGGIGGPKGSEQTATNRVEERETGLP